MSVSRGRGVSLVLAAALGVAALASLAPGSPAVASCAGAGPNHVALVVEHGDGSVLTRCVAFTTAQITGQQLLDASGVAWSGQTFGGFGVAACSIDGEPARYSTCPGKDFYWAVFVSRAGAAWQFAASGISTLTLSSGDAEGFRYVPAAGNAAAPPPPAGVCTAAGGGATSTAIPTRAPARTAPLVGAASAPGGSPGAPAGSATASPGPDTAATAGPSSAATTVGSGLVAVAAPPTPAASPAASPAPGAARAPAQDGGVDPGLLLAAVVGGGLGGLALLRLAMGRRGIP